MEYSLLQSFVMWKHSGKIVEESISHKITEKYRTESVSFHLKYWLKLTTLLLHQRGVHCQDSTQYFRMMSCPKQS